MSTQGVGVLVCFASSATATVGAVTGKLAFPILPHCDLLSIQLEGFSALNTHPFVTGILISGLELCLAVLTGEHNEEMMVVRKKEHVSLFPVT